MVEMVHVLIITLINVTYEDDLLTDLKNSVRFRLFHYEGSIQLVTYAAKMVQN